MTTAAAQAPAPGKLEFKDDYTPDEAERVIRNSKGLPVGVRPKMVWTWKKALLWAAIAIVCACGWAILAVSRGEQISAIWFLVVALSSYAIAYRFYAYYIQIKIMRTDDANATPAERVHDGANFERTDRRVLFGQHFAGISGAGPLVGPILAAQMGYLPSTLWIILGVIFAGAVQDMLVLWISAKRRGRSLGQMATDEMGKFGGMILSIFLVVMTAIAMAFLALVAIKAMAASPWAVFSIGMTIPIALIMGCYQRFLRPGRVIETTLLGFVLLVLDIVAGGWIASIPAVAAVFTLDAKQLVIALVIYSFAAAALPHWLLVTPRDYLSTLMKIGTLVLLVIGIIIANPSVKVPGLTELASTSTGPTFSGNLFPFLFITIACGAVSGFHALISSGTTPKLLANETDARFIGYGAMLMESFVAIMALVAASIIEPGLYFAMNTPPAGLGITMPNLHEMGGENAPIIMAQLKDVTAHAAATVSSWGFVISPEQILQTAKDIGEPSVLNRAGGAPTLAVGIAHVFHKVLPMADMGFWYHFGILFEALFILTALDAGTRSGRFMLQDLLGNFIPFLKKTDSLVAGIIGTAGCVGLWGYLLYQGVVDPLGGVKSLWPLFGISNQMLAAVALVLGTVVLIKMKRTQYIWVTVVPAVWLLICTTWALGLKLFSTNPQMEGFFYMASQYKEKIANGTDLTAQQIANMNHIVVNNYTNAGLSILFLIVVYSIIFYGFKTWLKVRNSDKRTDKETPYVPIPEGGVKISSHH